MRTPVEKKFSSTEPDYAAVAQHGPFVDSPNSGSIYRWDGLTTEQKVARVAAGAVLLAMLHGPIMQALCFLRREVVGRIRSGLEPLD